MSDTGQVDYGEPARAAGWLAFAGTLLIVGGAFKILDALWAFKFDDERSAEVQTVVFEGDLNAWGWVWLGIGVVLIIAGIAVVSGSEWARWFGIFVAAVAAIGFLPWIYFQPLWTILSVALCVMVVYALAMYGGKSGPGAVRRG